MGLFRSKAPKDELRARTSGHPEAGRNQQKWFKCPYCFEKIFEKGVAFRAMTAYTQQDLDDFTGAEKEKKMLYLQSADELYKKFWDRYPGSKPQDSDRNRTYERNPVISQYDARFLTNARFTDGSRLIFREDGDGFLNEVIDTEGNRSNIRICPHCHNRLPFEFGKYPVKYIPVVGITSSGKTVYLSQMLSKIKEILAQAGMTVAGLRPEVDEFVRKNAIRKGKKLPIGNPTDVLTTPLPVNVKNNRDGRRYTLVFYDIAGENCVKAEQMEKYGQFIRNADGIIMIMDPEQFTDLFYLDGDDDGDADDDPYSPDKVVEAMYTAFVSADFAGGESDIPLAAALSKSDLLKGTGVIGDYSNIFRQIPYEEYREKGFPHADWNDMRTEVEGLIRRSLEGRILDNGLRQFFPDHSYFAFTSLNTKPVEVGEGDARGYQINVNPEAVRIEEPLLWILHKLGIIEKAEKRRR